MLLKQSYYRYLVGDNMWILFISVVELKSVCGTGIIILSLLIHVQIIICYYYAVLLCPVDI